MLRVGHCLVDPLWLPFPAALYMFLLVPARLAPVEPLHWPLVTASRLAVMLRLRLVEVQQVAAWRLCLGLHCLAIPEALRSGQAPHCRAHLARWALCRVVVRAQALSVSRLDLRLPAMPARCTSQLADQVVAQVAMLPLLRDLGQLAMEAWPLSAAV